MKIIDNLFGAFEKIGAKFENKDKFLDFLFEYANQTLEHDKIEKNEKNISVLINNKLLNLYKKVEEIKRDANYKTIIIRTPEKSNLPGMIDYESKIDRDGLADRMTIENKY